MKCWKCHTTMIKDEYSRTATCPYCGRTVNYRTKSEKRGYSYSSGGSSGYSGDCFAGCASVLGIGALAIIALPLIILGLIFGDGFWSFLGGVISFIFNLVWMFLKFILEGIWWLIKGLFDLIF